MAQQKGSAAFNVSEPTDIRRSLVRKTSEKQSRQAFSDSVPSASSSDDEEEEGWPELGTSPPEESALMRHHSRQILLRRQSSTQSLPDQSTLTNPTAVHPEPPRHLPIPRYLRGAGNKSPPVQPVFHIPRPIGKMAQLFGSRNQQRIARESRRQTDVIDSEGERLRLEQDKRREYNWKRWGPYLSERQWGSVREDYSSDGDCWSYVSYEDAQSRAYRWGEDGLLGICDRQCRLCFGIALWNGKDPCLKERLFGLTGLEGNHGEDVKELYFYEKSTPTHSYMKGLYKYPHARFPYEMLRDENRRRTREEREFEILDTGIFDQSRYWDVSMEYAKASPNHMLIKITVSNRGDEEATLALLPTLWFRNMWTFMSEHEDDNSLKRINVDGKRVLADAGNLGYYVLECDAFEKSSEFLQPPKWIFCENNTNRKKLFGQPNETRYVKDGFHDYIVRGTKNAINEREGSKCALYLNLKVQPHKQVEVRLRLYDVAERTPAALPFDDFDELFSQRIREHDDFYDDVVPLELTAAEKEVCIQGLAGLLWSKQFYHYIVHNWLEGDPAVPSPPQSRRSGRNADWGHLFNRDVISMPDKWEYPWYAVWDLAFHLVTIAYVDIEFAKQQLVLFLREWYMHPNGCLPAYEFGFGDVNPPVHAWACYKVYKMSGDTHFLQSVFQKLIVNFTWWVNRKDPQGNNLFSGGFLGLDNIGVFDRSKPLPTGGNLQQADGTSWMAFYCLYMLKIAVELALKVDAVYEDMASKFFEHFVLIADAMNALTEGKQGLWDKEDGFFYDALVANGRTYPLKVRSFVGLTPLFATGTLPGHLMRKLKGFSKRTEWFLQHRRDLSRQIALLDEQSEDDSVGPSRLYLLSIPNKERIESMLRYLYDENEFLSDFGIRSVSRYHKDHPYIFRADNMEHCVSYLPGESNTPLFGGNSNWRGPIWFPMNFLLIEALERLDHFYAHSLTMPFPSNTDCQATPFEASIDICQRLASLFLPDEHGSRPCHGEDTIFSTDPNFKDLILFYEHFDGDNGRGLGASHQTGWTSLAVNCLFKIARYRGTRAELCSQSFLNRNYDNFDSSQWDIADQQNDPYLQFWAGKKGFQSVKAMMRFYFDKMPWRYRDLLVAYAVRTHPTLP